VAADGFHAGPAKEPFMSGEREWLIKGHILVVISVSMSAASTSVI
jgi:hypothetical protein